MATFGRYEATQELYRGKFVTISIAKALEGDPSTPYVISVFSPSLENLGAEKLKQESKAFLEAADIQQQTVRNGAQHWVPIHEYGDSPQGAYYVADFHDRTVRRLILGQVRLNGHTLHTIISHIIQGLIELRDACSRAHGDLNSHNVYLHENNKGLITKAVLANPLPTTRLDPATGHVADLRAVGEIIHELVLHKPLSAMGGWPVPESAEWSALGRNAIAWRELCNLLLDPDLSEQCPALDELAEHRLPALAQSSRRLGPIAAVAASSLVAVAVILIIWVWPSATTTPIDQLDQSKWAKLCTAYDDWVGPIYYVGYLNQKLDRWEQDKHLKVVTNHLETANAIDKIDPGKIGGLPGGPRTIWSSNPTDKAKSEQGIEDTEQAYDIVVSMETALTEWPPLQELQATQHRHTQMHWEPSAQYLNTLIASTELKWPDQGENRDNFITAYNRLLLNHKAITDLFKTADHPQQSNDEFRSLFFLTAVTYLKSNTISTSVTADDPFANNLRDLQTLKQHVEDSSSGIFTIQEQINRFRQDFAEDQILGGFQQDLDKFKNNLHSALNLIEKDVGIEQVTQASEGVKKKLTGLHKQVDGFLQTKPYGTDPRVALANLSHLDQIREQIVRIRAYKDTAQADLIDEKLTAQLDRMNEIHNRPWIRKHQKQIESICDAVSSGLIDLNKQANDRVAYLSQPLPGSDPRHALNDRMEKLHEDVRLLDHFNKKSSRKLSQLLESAQNRLAQSHQEYSKWVRAYETQINNLHANINDDLNSIDRELFPLLDPRKYWQWQSQVSHMQQELPNSEVNANVKKQFQTIQIELDNFQSLAWTNEDRATIEQQYQDYQSRLDELANQIITDPRNLFRKTWDQLAVQIEAVLKFRKDELQDPEHLRFASGFHNMESQKHQLEQLIWPDDAQSQSTIRSDVQQLTKSLHSFYDQIDPRPLWYPQAKRRAADILDGLEQLQSKSDPSEIEYRRQLNTLTSTRSNEPWSSATGHTIVNGIALNKQLLEKLYVAIYTKLDPRLQVAWDHVTDEIRNEIDQLKNTDKTAARQLSDQLRSIVSNVGQLNKESFNPKQKDLLERQTLKLESELLGVYISTISKPQQIDGVPSATISQAWSKRRQELIKSQNRVGTLLVDIHQLRKFLRDRHEKLSTLLETQSHPRSWKIDLASDAMIDKREDVLASAFQPWLTGQSTWQNVSNAARWKQIVTDYESWRTDVLAMMEDFGVIERSLENANGLNEVPQGYRETIGQLNAQWRQHKDLFGRFEKAIGPAIDIIASLIEIDRLVETDQLLIWANRGKADLDPAITFAAWRRLGETDDATWPTGIKQLKQEQDLRHWLAAMIRDSIADEIKKEALKQELHDQGHQRWSRCFSQMIEPEAMEKAMRLMDQFDVDITRLRPIAQFDLYLFKFKQAITALPHDSTAQQMQNEVQAFLQDLNQLPANIVKSSKTRLFLNEIEQLLAAKEEDLDQGADLAKAGPETSSIWNDIAWKRNESQDRTRVTYTWMPRRGTEHTIEFVRTEAGQTAPKSFYMSTTEISFGLLNDLFKSTDRWEHLKSLMGDPIWRGPKVWRWRKDKLRVNKHKGMPIWMPSDTLLKSGGGQIDDYVTGIDPQGPDEGYPMQYISPEAAIYFAKVLGCRLPTWAEWIAAVESETSGMALEQYVREHQPNLRDQTWLKQNEYVETHVKQGVRIYPPAAGALGTDQSDIRVRPYDDGVLWFDRAIPSQIAPGQLFHHLVGNVAEYVLQRTDQLDTLEVHDLPANEVLETIREVVGLDSIAVIGGSAQSPMSIPIDQPQQVAIDEVETTTAYSDVGFRLAFSAPRQSLKSQLQRYLMTQGYLASGTLGTTTSP